MKTRTLTAQQGQQFNISDFPNFSATGSITGMRKQFYGKDALLVKCGSYIYNVSNEIYNQAR